MGVVWVIPFLPVPPPPPKEDFLKFHTPRHFTSRCSPLDIQILSDFRASNPSEYHIQFWTPLDLFFVYFETLDLFFVDFETLHILTSFESQKEAMQTLGFSLKMAIWEPFGFTLPWGGGIKKWNDPLQSHYIAVSVSPTKVTAWA